MTTSPLRALYASIARRALQIGEMKQELNRINAQQHTASVAVGAATAAANESSSSADSSSSSVTAARDELQRNMRIAQLQMRIMAEYREPAFQKECEQLLTSFPIGRGHHYFSTMGSGLTEVEIATVREEYRTLVRLLNVPRESMSRRVKQEDALKAVTTMQLWQEASTELERHLQEYERDDEAEEGKILATKNPFDAQAWWESTLLVPALDADLRQAVATGEAMARAERENKVAPLSTVGWLKARPFDGLVLHHEVATHSLHIVGYINQITNWVPHALRNCVMREREALRAQTTVPDGAVELPASSFTRPCESAEAARAFLQDIAQRVGFDLSRGRIDLLRVPPSSSQVDIQNKSTRQRFRGGGSLSTSFGFTTATSPDDVHITIPLAGTAGAGRYLSPARLLRTLMHELGHALYEQNRPGAKREALLLPPGAPVVECRHELAASLPRSVAVNESQALLFESLLERRAFFEFLHPVLAKHFPDCGSPLAAYQAWRYAERGSTNVTITNLHRCLHLCVLAEVERDLINTNGTSPPEHTLGEASKDIPDFIRSQYDAYLGGSAFLFDPIDPVDDPQLRARIVVQRQRAFFTRSALQLTKLWASGLFAYTPSYLLGSIYTTHWVQAIEHDLGCTIDACLSTRGIEPVNHWLCQRVWQRGSIPEDVRALFIEATRDKARLGYFIDSFRHVNQMP